MGSRSKFLASAFKQTADILQVDSTSSHRSTRMTSGFVPPCCRSLMQWTSRQSFSSRAVHNSRCYTSAVGHDVQPTKTAQVFSSSFVPVGAGHCLLRSTGGFQSRAFTFKSAQQQQPATQDDALLRSASAMRSADACTTIHPSASTSAQAQASVEGTIQRITYSSEETGYTVAKMKVDSSRGFAMPHIKNSSRNGLITVTGKFLDMAVGQQWKCDGNWIKHNTYGHQLVAAVAEELRPASSGNLVAYLCGGATKGVGPVTAGNMVQKYGDAILEVLDSSDAVQKLMKVKGIGNKTAIKIKDEWEKRRGAILYYAGRRCHSHVRAANSAHSHVC